VEHSVEKLENATFTFDKQRGFNGLHNQLTRQLKLH